MKWDRKKIISRSIGALGAVCFIVIGVTVYRNFIFSIRSISPSPSRVATATPYFLVTFSHDVEPVTTAKNVFSSQGIVKTASSNKNTLKIYVKTLTDGQKYQIKLRDITSKKNGKSLSKTLSFTAKYIPFNKLSKEEQQRILEEQDKKSVSGDPILQFLPYFADSYQLKAAIDGDTVTIVFNYTPNMVDEREGDTARERYFAEAKAYLTAKGIDLNKYTIIDSEAYNAPQPD